MRFRILLSALLLLPLASASVTFDIQGTYVPGDYTLRYTVTNDLDTSADFTVSPQIYYEGEPDIAQIPPRLEEITLGPGQSTALEVGFAVSDTQDAGLYEFIVGVVDPEGAAETYSEMFEVTGTFQEFNLIILTCDELSCEAPSSTFVLADAMVYVQVENAEGAQLTGELIKPGGVRSPLQYADGKAVFNIDQVGDYVVKATARMEGFKTEDESRTITVIEAVPEVEDLRICDVNGVCDGAENRQNCPQDCLEGEMGPEAEPPPEVEITEEGEVVLTEEGAPVAKPPAGGIGTVEILAIVLILIVIAILVSRRKK